MALFPVANIWEPNSPAASSVNATPQPVVFSSQMNPLPPLPLAPSGGGGVTSYST